MKGRMKEKMMNGEWMNEELTTSKSVPMNEGDKMFGNLSSMLGIYCVSA